MDAWAARRVLGALALALFLLTTGCAGADAIAFDKQARAVDQALAGYVGEGVPASALEPVRAGLRELRIRRSGPLPYSVFSGAAVRDPFLALELQARAARRRSVQEARLEAEAALSELKLEPQPPAAVYQHIVELAQAGTPAAYRSLAARMRTETAVIRLSRRELERAGGGLVGGQPADIANGEAQLLDLVGVTDRLGLSSDPGPAALADVQLYLAQPAPAQVDNHDALAQEVAAVLNKMQRRVDTRARGDALFGQLPALLGQLHPYGGADTFAARAEEDHQALLASSGDEQLVRAVSDLQSLVDEMSGALGSGRLPLAGVACLDSAPAQLIEIHLATQQLIAYQGGCPILRTPVTTGRPALPTDRGTFRIFYKAPAYKMVSPWPPGSPYWYATAWVYWAMEFVGDGTFIHNADWQPDDSYGPGSQYGPYASHGCIHVLDGPLQSLYAWAQLGTTVAVGD